MKQLRHFRSEMLQKYYEDNDSIDNVIKFSSIFDSDLNNSINEIIERNGMTYHFYIDEIKNLLEQSPQ